jgi:hypothetical protein
MNRLLITCCGVVLLGSSMAFADDAVFDPSGKTVSGKRSVLSKHGLAEFDLDGNGTLDATERATALAARNAARHQPSFPALNSLGNQTLMPHSPSTAYKNYGLGYSNLGFGRGGNSAGSILVVNQPAGPVPCTWGQPPSNLDTAPSLLTGGGSVVLPGRIITPGANGQCVLTGPGGTVVTSSGVPPIMVWPQIPHVPGDVTTAYWIPGANSGQQPQGMGTAMNHVGHHGR